VSLRQGHYLRIVVDGLERCSLIHAQQQPCSAVPGTGAELEQAAARLRRCERSQQSTHFRL
jgi:hypothetical protein